MFKTQQLMTTSAAAMQHEMHPSRAQTDICISQARGKTQRMQAQAPRPVFRWVTPSNRYMPFALFMLLEHFAAMLHQACRHSSRQYHIGVLQPVLPPILSTGQCLQHQRPKRPGAEITDTQKYSWKG